MKIRLITVSVASVLSASIAIAAGSGMPGDNGKPGNGAGIPAVNPPPRPASAAVPVARAPAIGVALKAAQAIAAACGQYPLGIAVVNAEGAPIFVYIPDDSRASHTYTAIRKAYSAVQYKVPTAQMISKAQQDPDFAATIKADPNLVAFGGGIPLKVGDDIIGAIGVSGAEPGSHDEECGLKGLEAIKAELK